MANRELQALSAVPLFDGLTTRHLKHVSALADTADYMRGAALVKQGDEAESFFVILEGELKVTTGPRTIAKLLPGDHFGEISLLDGGKRTASVIAETPVTVLKIDRDRFTKLLTKEPLMTKALLKSMARMIRRTDRSLAG